MRNAFAEEITDLASRDGRVVLLSGDIGNRLFDRFKEAAPGRFFNCGVAEANMTGAAAGMAFCGLRPFTYTITPFATLRCFEQIRIDVCYHNVPVTVVGTGAGLSYAGLGPTHHSCDDIGTLRLLPNLSILCPCDRTETRLAVRAALEHSGPVYLRLGKKGEPDIHRSEPPFVIGRSITLREGGDLCILSTGNIAALALEVADELGGAGLEAGVESFHTVKPLDEELLTALCRAGRTIVTMEEHSLIGGLGSAVAEWAADFGPSAPRILRFGTGDTFLDTLGSQDYVRGLCGLEVSEITRSVVRALRPG